jgi:hypothetical protein
LRHGIEAQEKSAQESFGWKIHTCIKKANGRDVKPRLLPAPQTRAVEIGLKCLRPAISRYGAPRS